MSFLYPRAAPAALLLILGLPSASPVRADNLPDSRQAYLQRFDDDGDGRVSRSEYLNYMSLGFEAMDRNHDGRLDAEELPPGARGRVRDRATHQQAVLRQFGRLDRDADGWLSASELTAPPG